jgi:hypothetical protein
MIDEIVIRLKYAFFRAREEGFIWFCKKITLKVIGFIMYLLLFPLNIILYFLNFRLVPILSNRIGHLSGEVDCFVKLKNWHKADINLFYQNIRENAVLRVNTFLSKK